MSHYEHIQRIIKPIGRFSDYFGGTVIFSGDASVLVITAAAFDTIDHNFPTVSIYNLVDGQYEYHSDLDLPPDVKITDHSATYCQINYDGTLIAINSEHHNEVPKHGGAMFMYAFAGGVWGLRKEIRVSPIIDPPSGNQTHEFGFQFSLTNDGNTMLVSAPFDNGDDTGAGLCFVLTTTNNWQTYSHVEVHNPLSNKLNGWFGYNCVISGDGSTLFIGVYDPTVDKTIVTWFRKISDIWTYHGNLTGSGTLVGGLFGFSAPISLQTEFAGVGIACNYDATIVVIGDREKLSNKGEAYIFKEVAVNYVETQKIDFTETGGWAGYSVAIDDIGTFVVIGVQGEDSEGFSDVGVNYIYEYDGSNFVFNHKVSAPVKEHWAYGAFKVAISAGCSYFGAGSIQDTNTELYAGSVNIWKLETDPTLLPARADNFKAIITEAEYTIEATDFEFDDINSKINREWKFPGKRAYNTVHEDIVISQGWRPQDVWWHEDDTLAHTPI